MEKDLEIALDEKGQLNDKVHIPIAKSKPPLSTSTNEEPRHEIHHLSTAQSNRLSLAEVGPVDVQVRDLAVNVDLSASPLSLASLLPRKRNRDGGAKLETKQILH